MEVDKLLEAGFIREIQYPTWLENVVMIKKASEKWRICTDYSDLNKHCLKDTYPLSSVDSLVDGASGHRMLSLMDAYSRYNQIRMDPLDEGKTAFMTEKVNYCYTTMLFGLKNAGATYQRLMAKFFDRQIGRVMEVYVDDMVVKADEIEEHCNNLKEVFEEIRHHSIRLSPEKSSFGVAGGRFLGFMISQRGIDGNPDKCKAIIEMSSPKNVKKVQRLAGRMAALSRFLPQSGRMEAPFYKCLRKYVITLLQ